MELQKSVAPSGKQPVNALKGPSKPEPAASTKKSSSSMWKTIKSYMPSRGVATDVALFGAAVYIVVYHGKDIADAFDGICPNEE